ncbi:MAG: hypothetical protein M5R40_02465 [Anaerolineae bacterium]|nr:hypothetical protein [Anaerolineae bacterium]
MSGKAQQLPELCQPVAPGEQPVPDDDAIQPGGGDALHILDRADAPIASTVVWLGSSGRSRAGRSMSTCCVTGSLVAIATTRGSSALTRRTSASLRTSAISVILSRCTSEINARSVSSLST